MSYLVERLSDDLPRVLEGMSFNQKVELINSLREVIHINSPFKNEPVDFVKWVEQENVIANDYNPNKVAPPEMELLEVSIMNDGYTQPIVTWPHDGKVEVIDGFHRNRVGKESKVVGERIKGYLPSVIIRKEQSGKNDRIASTIRHNRARGKHQVDAMSEIVIELKNRNWRNARIARELGMDEEEIIRLCQISGLEDLFSDQDFSKAWESSDSIAEFEPISDDLNEEEIEAFRTANTNDPDRIFHTYDKWECHKAGFYKPNKEGMTEDECKQKFADFFREQGLFESVLKKITSEWKHSCEHYLTNKAMNRIAWLGQACVCYHLGIPSKYSSGYNLLNENEQAHSNHIALKHLNKWLLDNNRHEISIEEALSIGRQVEIY